MGLSGTEWTLAAGDHHLTVAEVGASLRHYTHGGQDVTCTWDPHVLAPKGCGGTLVPWPNRIRDGRYDVDGAEQQLALTEPAHGNAIHGLGRWARWAPVRQEPERLLLGLDIVPQKGYPFEVRAEVTYALDADTGLTVTLAARNVGSTPAPFGAGSHPYLSTRGHRLDDVTLQLPAREILEVDDQQIPVGRRRLADDEDYRAGRQLGSVRFDSGFTDLERGAGGCAEAAIRTPAGGARVWFEPDFGFLQVYTLDELTPGQSGVAIEPMTCAPDAFNSGDGLRVLEPGGAWSARWGIVPT